MTVVPGMPMGSMPPGNFYPFMPAMPVPSGVPITPPYNQTNAIGFPQPNNITTPSALCSPGVQNNMQGGKS